MKTIAHLFISILITFFVSGISVFSQKETTVIIKGNANCPAGEEICLTVFDDLINYNPLIVSTDKIAKDGSFKLTLKTNKTQLVRMSIRNMKGQFFVVPNHTYNLTVELDTALLPLLDPEAFMGFLNILNNDSDTAELNYKIDRFNSYFNNVVSYYGPYLTYRKDMEKYDTVTNLLREKFQIQYNPTNFYHSYLYYSNGLIDFMIYQKYPDSLYKRYFDNEYLLYDNPAYMNLFTNFYDNYLYGSKYISKEILTRHINDTPDYLSLFNELGKDPYLVNEKIRELVILICLKNFYPNKEEFDRLNVLKLIEHIKNHSRFPEHRNIAQNIINTITRFETGALMPEISLKRANGSEVKIEKFTGKWTYIQFFNTYCTDCIRDMLVLVELQRKYGDRIRFVSISIDGDFMKFSKFVQQYKMDGIEFYHFNNRYDWLNKLEINSLPDNILLNPDGNLAIRHAPDPNRSLAKFLLQKFSKSEEDKNPMFYTPKN